MPGTLSLEGDIYHPDQHTETIETKVPGPIALVERRKVLAEKISSKKNWLSKWAYAFDSFAQGVREGLSEQGTVAGKRSKKEVVMNFEMLIKKGSSALEAAQEKKRILVASARKEINELRFAMLGMKLDRELKKPIDAQEQADQARKRAEEMSQKIREKMNLLQSDLAGRRAA